MIRARAQGWALRSVELKEADKTKQNKTKPQEECMYQQLKEKRKHSVRIKPKEYQPRIHLLQETSASVFIFKSREEGIPCLGYFNN